jgi:hypothetical protein
MSVLLILISSTYISTVHCTSLMTLSKTHLSYGLATKPKLFLGVIRGGPELYPSVMGTLAPVATPSLSVSINYTGCLLSNFCKEAIARQLVDLTPTAASERRVVTLADGSTVNTVGSIVCNLRLTCNTVAVSLKSITIHILPELAFDVILGYPTIRRYNLLSLFYSLFCETDLQIHNCKSCRQCLPAVFQQETSLAAEATQAEVLREAPLSGALEVARDCRRLSEGAPDVAVIEGSCVLQALIHACSTSRFIYI